MGDLNWVELFYWVAFLLGFGFAVVGVVGHGFGGGDGVDTGGDLGHDLAHDAGVDHASPFNSLTIAAFSTGLGALGLLGLRVLGLTPALSLLFAVAGGLAIGALFFFAVFRPLVRSQSDSTPDIKVLMEAPAVVRTPIPVDGFGEIVLQAGGSTFPMPARSEEGREILSGVRVAVMRIAKGVAYVVPLDEESLGFEIRGDLS